MIHTHNTKELKRSETSETSETVTAGTIPHVRPLHNKQIPRVIMTPGICC